MPNDLNLANFGHVPQVFSLGGTKKFRRVRFRYMERRTFPCRFSRGRLFEDQTLILIRVAGSLAGHVLHRVTSSTSLPSFSDESDCSLWAINPATVSVALRVVISVQHHREALPSSG